MLIVLVTVAVYSPVLKQGFFNWDDPKHVKAVWKPSWERAWKISTDFDLQYTTVAYFIPLHFLSLMADQALLGNVDQPQAWISKTTNVLLHAANAALVFILLLALGTGWRAALFAALIFAVHPVQVGTVAWIVERKNVLSTFFYLSALLVFIRFCRTGRFALAASVVTLFAAGLLSKPSVVTLPVVMLAGLLLLQIKEYPGKGPWTVIAIVFAMALAWGTYVVSTEVSYPGILPPWYIRPLLAGRVIWFYLATLVYPHDLVVIYPRWDVGAHLREFFVLFVALTAFAAAVVYAWYRHWIDAITIWGIVFFLVNILPVSGLAPFGYMGHSFVADHFLYLPFVGLTVIVARCVDFALAGLRKCPLGSVISYAGAAIVLAMLAFLSVKQVMLWQDPALLWDAALKMNKRSTAIYMNYGAICMERGQADKALGLFRKAAELSPNFPASYNNMGRILLAQRRRDEAKRMFEKSLAVDPRGVVPLVMLAQVLNEENKPREAIALLEKSVARAPANATLRTQLAHAYRLAGDNKQALRQLDRAIEIAPLAPAPYIAKADLLLTHGNADEAIALLRRALERGTDPEARNMLGAALAQKGDIGQALEEFRKAYQLAPALPGLRDNIANALMDMHEYDRAQEFCSSARKSGMPCSRATLDRLGSDRSNTDKVSP